MTQKPLVFVKQKIKLNDEEFDSWDLLAFGPCPIIHAAWNPQVQMLVVQFDSVKEGFADLPRKTKTKVVMQETRVEQYYRITMTDKEAIQYIFDNFVGNYHGQEWDVKVEEHDQAPVEFPEDVDHESILVK